MPISCAIEIDLSVGELRDITTGVIILAAFPSISEEMRPVVSSSLSFVEILRSRDSPVILSSVLWRPISSATTNRLLLSPSAELCTPPQNLYNSAFSFSCFIKDITSSALTIKSESTLVNFDGKLTPPPHPVDKVRRSGGVKPGLVSLTSTSESSSQTRMLAISSVLVIIHSEYRNPRIRQLSLVGVHRIVTSSFVFT